jgi:hypothetical protein
MNISSYFNVHMVSSILTTRLNKRSRIYVKFALILNTCSPVTITFLYKVFNIFFRFIMLQFILSAYLATVNHNMMCSHRRSDQLDQARSSDRVPV